MYYCSEGPKNWLLDCEVVCLKGELKTQGNRSQDLRFEKTSSTNTSEGSTTSQYKDYNKQCNRLINVFHPGKMSSYLKHYSLNRNELLPKVNSCPNTGTTLFLQKKILKIQDSTIKYIIQVQSINSAVDLYQTQIKQVSIIFILQSPGSLQMFQSTEVSLA